MWATGLCGVCKSERSSDLFFALQVLKPQQRLNIVNCSCFFPGGHAFSLLILLLLSLLFRLIHYLLTIIATQNSSQKCSTRVPYQDDEKLFFSEWFRTWSCSPLFKFWTIIQKTHQKGLNQSSFRPSANDRFSKCIMEWMKLTFSQHAFYLEVKVEVISAEGFLFQLQAMDP